MSTDDERDLAGAFDELTAPPSTANYATRTSAPEIRTTATRWPQALATALAVLVAVAASGTFLALRSARQGGAPAVSTGTPPARSGAAMAFDSTAGVTVMYGGSDGSGRLLADTWTWNGSAWTPASRGPASLGDVRMVDDPADGGVLLVGDPVNADNGSSASRGCAAGSAGGTTGGGGSGSAGSATASATLPPGLTPVRPTGPPLNDPLPTAVSAPAVTSTPGPATPTCPPATSPPVVAPSSQTWLFRNGGWNRVGSGSAASAPPADSQMAFDATTHQVVAVSSAPFACGPPLAVPADSAIACPATGLGSRAVVPAMVPAAPCSVLVGCLSNTIISTWTWAHGAWSEGPPKTPLDLAGITLLFDDPATKHATLMTQFDVGLYGVGSDGGSGFTCASGTNPAIKAAPCIPPGPLVATWTWTGSAWTQVSQLQNTQQFPSFSAANVAAVAGRIVVLTAAGQTWTFAAGQWTQETVAGPSPRAAAAVAEGPSGTVVLFGGITTVAFPVGARVSSPVGSDTWTWNGSAWRQLGGVAPAPPPTGNPCPTGKNDVIPPCAPQPLPAEVSPATPAVTPAVATATA